MSDRFVIWIPGEPPMAWGKNSKQYSKRGDRVIVRKHKNIVATEDWLRANLANRAERERLGPLRLHVTVVWNYLAKHPKAVKEAGTMIYKTTKPDGNNITASIEDVMEKCGFYKNDAQIYCETIDRWYGPHPGIRIELIEVDK